MGNTGAREKGRHVSGDDQGPTMRMSLDLDESGEFPSGFMRSIQHTDEDGYPTRRMRASTITEGPGSDIGPKKLPTVFKWEGGGKNVCISGSFDGWKAKIPLVKSHDDFYTILDLPEGTHQYKFLVDGQWVCDENKPKCPTSPRHNGRSTPDSKAANNLGSCNNQVEVKEADFEVFEALAMDSVSTGHNKMGGSGSPPGTYTQEIPSRHAGGGGFGGFHHSGPPILPPHLLQVILNKETSSHCEPTLLPEPNHVMLNHLYALSIKDGVMVLSATHRYRKKYVTTLLYKPIK